jgi:hypothetical protein
MTDKLKDKIVGAIFSALVSVLIFVIGFWATGIRISDDSINKRIDSKVDKEQYAIDCKVHEKRLDAIDKTVHETNKELVRILYEVNNRLGSIESNIGKIETDVTWLKRSRQ